MTTWLCQKGVKGVLINYKVQLFLINPQVPYILVLKLIYYKLVTTSVHFYEMLNKNIFVFNLGKKIKNYLRFQF